MATPDDLAEDIFQPDGRLRLDLWTPPALDVLRASLEQARQTCWDSLRSPHVFMGLLAAPDAGVQNWGERLEADLPSVLQQFQELFRQDPVEGEAVLALNREFLSDKVIHLFREARQRAAYYGRGQCTPMDLLISLLTAPNSIVAECFERVGVTAAKLTELAVIAEHHARPD
jgi:ATP-dependent Clp protease ATP-binding subunit ClpA